MTTSSGTRNRPVCDGGAVRTWCRARVAETERRLTALDPAMSTVLVSHWPLLREPTRVLWYPEFALWCGTELP